MMIGQVKLFWDGKYLILCGMVMIFDQNNVFFWIFGYVLRLDIYIGLEMLNFLNVIVLKLFGERLDIEMVLFDILVLMKINYNVCNYLDGLFVII